MTTATDIQEIQKTKAQYPAEPTKLNDGTWGARVLYDTVEEGDVVEVSTRAGKTWNSRVTKVLWTGNGVAVCAVTSRPQQDSPRSGGVRRRINEDDASIYGSQYLGREGEYAVMPA